MDNSRDHRAYFRQDEAAMGFLNAVVKCEVPPTPVMRGTTVYNEETVNTREGLTYDQILREYIKLIEETKRA